MDLIKKLEEVKIERDDVLVSFDVTSLFPSIPLDKVVINLEKWLSSLYFSKFEISEYVALTKLCILHNAFKFGENFYIQNNGLAMGNPLSPFLANLFMSEFETHITSSFPWMYKSWNRYVDDIFCIVKEKHLDDSLNLLNIQDKNINFTMEIEKSDYLPFLDLRIIKK